MPTVWAEHLHEEALFAATNSTVHNDIRDAVRTSVISDDRFFNHSAYALLENVVAAVSSATHSASLAATSAALRTSRQKKAAAFHPKRSA